MKSIIIIAAILTGCGSTLVKDRRSEAPKQECIKVDSKEDLLCSRRGDDYKMSIYIRNVQPETGLSLVESEGWKKTAKLSIRWEQYDKTYTTEVEGGQASLTVATISSDTLVLENISAKLVSQRGEKKDLHFDAMTFPVTQW